MNDVIKSGNIIKKIRDGKQLEEIALFARNCIFRDGPKDTLVLEILSYLKLFQPTFFEKFEDELIETMGLFFKNPSPDTLQGVVFDMYRQHIKEKYGEDYTPMQASILEQIEDKHHFSFSAPTSTGKSLILLPLSTLSVLLQAIFLKWHSEKSLRLSEMCKLRRKVKIAPLRRNLKHAMM